MTRSFLVYEIGKLGSGRRGPGKMAQLQKLLLCTHRDRV